MRKIHFLSLLLLLVSSILLFSLVACDQGQQPNNGDNSSPTTQDPSTEYTPSTDENPSSGEQTPITPPSSEHENIHVHNFYYGRCGTCDIVPSNTWDISKSGDGSLKAYLYAIDSNYTLEIAGDGEMLEQEYNVYMPWRQYRDSITEIIFNGALTHISRQAFNGCAIRNIGLPDTLKYIGEEAFSACTKLTELTISSNVVEIGRLAFFMCTKLEKVDIPLCTEVIGVNAFQYCPELTTVTFGKNTTSVAKTLTIQDGAFSTCAKLTNISIPNHTIQVGIDVFKDSSDSIYSYYENIAYIGQWLIKPQMTNIQSVVFKDSCIGIADGAFDNCDNLSTVTVPATITILGAYAFRGCDKLQTIELPITITELKSGTFYECKNLQTVSIPKYTTSIGNYAFYNCDALEGIIIPVEIQTIGNSAFYGCDSLTQLAIISQSIETIGQHCFYDCPKLKYVSYAARKEHWEQTTIEQGNTALTNAVIIFNVSSNHLHTIVTTEAVEPTCYSRGYTSSAYCSACLIVLEEKEDLGTINHEYDADDFCSCGQKKPTEGLIFEITFYNSAYKVMGISDTTIANIVIPKYHEGLPVIEIDYEAFKGNRNITTVYLPSTVTTIGQSAFDGCNNLEMITLSEGLETIGNFAFSDCVDLATIILPQSLKEIGAFAFVECTALDNVVLPSGLEVLGAAAFQSCSSLKSITIPNKIKGIESNTFAFCSSLTAIELHNEIEYIDEWAFYCCESLTEFLLPASVEWIGKACFAYCDELTRIELNAILKEIDAEAFQGCTKLATITYAGTAENWTSVELNDNWNRRTAITKIECSNGDVTIDSVT